MRSARFLLPITLLGAVLAWTVPQRAIPPRTVLPRTVLPRTVPRRTVPRRTVPRRTVPRRIGARSSAQAGLTVHASSSQAPRPALRFVSPVVALGALEADAEREAFADWHCEGSGTLRVLALRPDCRCAEATGLPAYVQGGTRGRLRVRLRVPRRGGVFVARIRVITDGPPGADVHTLVLSGHVTGDWTFEPSLLDLGRWEPGRRVVRMVSLSGPPADVSGLLLRHLEPRVDGFAGRVGVLSPTQAGPGACARLRVEIRMPAEGGVHRGHVLVHVPDGEARLLPIRCTVVPDAPGRNLRTGKGSPAESEHTENAHDVQVPDSRLEPAPDWLPGRR